MSNPVDVSVTVSNALHACSDGEFSDAVSSTALCEDINCQLGLSVGTEVGDGELVTALSSPVYKVGAVDSNTSICSTRGSSVYDSVGSDENGNDFSFDDKCTVSTSSLDDIQKLCDRILLSLSGQIIQPMTTVPKAVTSAAMECAEFPIESASFVSASSGTSHSSNYLTATSSSVSDTALHVNDLLRIESDLTIAGDDANLTSMYQTPFIQDHLISMLPSEELLQYNCNSTHAKPAAESESFLQPDFDSLPEPASMVEADLYSAAEVESVMKSGRLADRRMVNEESFPNDLIKVLKSLPLNDNRLLETSTSVSDTILDEAYSASEFTSHSYPVLVKKKVPLDHMNMGDEESLANTAMVDDTDQGQQNELDSSSKFFFDFDVPLLKSANHLAEDEAKQQSDSQRPLLCVTGMHECKKERRTKNKMKSYKNEHTGNQDSYRKDNMSGKKSLHERLRDSLSAETDIFRNATDRPGTYGKEDVFVTVPISPIFASSAFADCKPSPVRSPIATLHEREYSTGELGDRIRAKRSMDLRSPDKLPQLDVHDLLHIGKPTDISTFNTDAEILKTASQTALPDNIDASELTADQKPTLETGQESVNLCTSDSTDNTSNKDSHSIDTDDSSSSHDLIVTSDSSPIVERLSGFIPRVTAEKKHVNGTSNPSSACTCRSVCPLECDVHKEDTHLLVDLSDYSTAFNPSIVTEKSDVDSKNNDLLSSCFTNTVVVLPRVSGTSLSETIKGTSHNETEWSITETHKITTEPISTMANTIAGNNTGVSSSDSRLIAGKFKSYITSEQYDYKYEDMISSQSHNNVIKGLVTSRESEATSNKYRSHVDSASANTDAEPRWLQSKKRNKDDASNNVPDDPSSFDMVNKPAWVRYTVERKKRISAMLDIERELRSARRESRSVDMDLTSKLYTNHFKSLTAEKNFALNDQPVQRSNDLVIETTDSDTSKRRYSQYRPTADSSVVLRKKPEISETLVTMNERNLENLCGNKSGGLESDGLKSENKSNRVISDHCISQTAVAYSPLKSPYSPKESPAQHSLLEGCTITGKDVDPSESLDNGKSDPLDLLSGQDIVCSPDPFAPKSATRIPASVYVPSWLTDYSMKSWFSRDTPKPDEIVLNSTSSHSLLESSKTPPPLILLNTQPPQSSSSDYCRSTIMITEPAINTQTWPSDVKPPTPFLKRLLKNAGESTTKSVKTFSHQPSTVSILKPNPRYSVSDLDLSPRLFSTEHVASSFNDEFNMEVTKYKQEAERKKKNRHGIEKQQCDADADKSTSLETNQKTTAASLSTPIQLNSPLPAETDAEPVPPWQKEFNLRKSRKQAAFNKKFSGDSETSTRLQPEWVKKVHARNDRQTQMVIKKPEENKSKITEQLSSLEWISKAAEKRARADRKFGSFDK